MEVRAIRPEEKIFASKIQTVAFLFSRDFSSSRHNPEEFAGGYETTRAAFDDNGKMCSCMELIPYSVRFDGHTVKMGGIGAVATLPEERKKRYIRHIFELVMDEMYENGYIFSYLYPFSHVFYRKFGYELNMLDMEYSIPFSALNHFSQDGNVKMHVDGMDTSDVTGVYNRFIQDKNLAVIRDERLWKRFFEKDPYKDHVFLYIWYNSDNKPMAYIKFSVARTGDFSRNMQVNEFVWLDTESLKGMFTFLKQFASHYDKILWKCPKFLDILSLFPEPYNVECKVRTSGMNRVVNCIKALELIKVPEGSGEVTVEVLDGFYPKNTGRYDIAWENGTLGVRPGRKDPDMVCGISEFSQLLTGFASVRRLVSAGRIEVRNKEHALTGLFAEKDLFLNDYF